MAHRPDPVTKKFGSQRDKTLKNVLTHRILKDFPRVGGPRIGALCAEMILEVVAEYVRPQDHVQHGQVLWMAVSVEDPPRRYRRRGEMTMVPVILDLSTVDDIEARIDRVSAKERHTRRAVRLCEQAFCQGGLLSNADLSELMTVDAGTLGQLLSAHEDRTGKVVPRRATIHDVGTGMTHKRIICRKRFVEGKEAEQIARETHHSLESVDRYLGQYDRVRQCRLLGLSAKETASVLDCSQRLVREYLELDRELEGREPKS